MACEEGSITIPHDIIIDILLRLPAKSLGQFRCVSKEWLSLLSDPGFIKTHEKTLNRTHLIFQLNYHRSIYSLPFDNHEGVSTLTKLPFESNAYLQGSYNGLVLVAVIPSSGTYILYIINPTTKDSVQLAYNFVIDYKHHYALYGFGYDCVADDYKVVSMTYHTHISPDENIMQVYSLRTNTWRKMSPSPYDHSRDYCSSGVFIKGFLHWIARKRPHPIPVVVAYSLADEKFSEVPSPRFYNDVDISSVITCKLAALSEKLAIFDDVKGVVWLMNEYGVKESWTKIVVHGLSKTLFDEPMIFYDNGKIVFVNRDLKVLKNAEEKCMSKTDDLLSDEKVLKFQAEGTYIESLFFPKIGPTN